jgi:O-antigen/teichoic acid export membrane protein
VSKLSESSPAGAPSIWATVRLPQRLLTLVGASGLGQLFSLVYTLLLAHQLALPGYSAFAACFATAGLSAFLINWGMDTYLLRQSATHSHADELTGQVLTLKLAFGLLWALACILILPRLRPELYWPDLLGLCLLDTWCEDLFDAQSARLNGSGKVRQAAGLAILLRGGRLLAAAGLVLAAYSSPTQYAAARLGATVLALAAMTLIARPRFASSSIQKLKSVLHSALPYGISDMLALIYFQADLTLLALISSSPTAVGSYAPALTLTNALFVFPGSAYTLLVPALAALRQQQPDRYKSLKRWIYPGFTALGALLWPLVWWGGSSLTTRLLGAAYQQSGALLAALSPILFLKCVSFAGATLLVAADRQAERLGPQLLSAAVNILFNLWAIPRWGAWGAAWVYVLSEALLATGYGLALFRSKPHEA